MTIALGSVAEQNKAIVDAYYQAAVQGKARDFGVNVVDEFTLIAPGHLPLAVVMTATSRGLTSSITYPRRWIFPGSDTKA